jgi:hypothetical protein
MTDLDLSLVSQTTERYLNQAVRGIAYTCPSTGNVTELSAKLAASPIGALPTLAVTAESLWCEGTGRRFGLDLALDPATPFGYRLQTIRHAPFTAVMLAIIEAIESAKERDVLQLNRLADVWAQAEDRIAMAAERIAA